VSADVGVRLIGGGLAGITAASITYPLDLVRTRLAAQVIHIPAFLQHCQSMAFLTNNRSILSFYLFLFPKFYWHVWDSVLATVYYGTMISGCT